MSTHDALLVGLIIFSIMSRLRILKLQNKLTELDSRLTSYIATYGGGR